MKLLLVDDDPDLLAITVFVLQQAGFEVMTAGSVADALRAFRRERPDLVLLDINLPDGLGFDAATSIRAESPVPIMMLTVRGEEEDLVRALELGADDYLAKPFSPKTLIARIRALLRRAGLEPAGPVTAGALALDADNLTLLIGEARKVSMTPLECRVLRSLFANAGRPVQADHLLAHVWGRKDHGDRQVLKQVIHRLRHKLGTDDEDQTYIETVPGVGYRLRTHSG
jgi:DNA-binding response OmpR family regulator